VARAYSEFAGANPALYDAMFTLTTSLQFGYPVAASPLQAGFQVFVDVLAPLADEDDVETLAEVTWAALHGLVTLTRSGRLRPEQEEQRLAVLVSRLS
jgi:hypothetical protein